MKKDTRFPRKYSSNDKVWHRNNVWTVCKSAEQDGNKHLRYMISRGAWRKYVRGDLLVSI